MSSARSDSPPDPVVLREAARWMAQLASGDAGAREHAACTAWREADPAHEAAWQRAQHLFARLQSLPAPLARQALDRPRCIARRAALRGLLGIAVAVPIGGVWYRHSRADHRTATGQRLLAPLPGGGTMLLDTASTVRIEQAPDLLQVHLLAGRIRLDGGARGDLLLHGQGGRFRPQPQTRFVLDDTGDGSLLAVEDGEVGFIDGGVHGSLRTGLQQRIGAGDATAAWALDEATLGWIHGLLYADDQPLDGFLRQLARYRSGWLRCDPAVAGLRISGVFHTDDTDHVLEVLARTLPLRIARHGPWTRVLPR